MTPDLPPDAVFDRWAEYSQDGNDIAWHLTIHAACKHGKQWAITIHANEEAAEWRRVKLPPRIEQKIVNRPGSDCWIWTARVDKCGYGAAWDGKAMRPAHRVVYSLLVGPIPKGLQLDHLCLVKLCVNPDHLEPVTQAENMRRRYANVDACAHGHPYDAANTYRRPSGHRDCRICINERQRRYKARAVAA